MSILTEKVPAPTIEQRNTSPDTGRGLLPLNSSCTVKFSLVKDIKSNGPSSDYDIVINFLKSGKSSYKEDEEGIDVETILADALKEIGYEVEEYTLNTTFENWEKLQGGLKIGHDWAASYRGMKAEEIVENKKLIESGILPEDNELVQFSNKLQGVEWELVSVKKVSEQGIKAVLVRKNKLEVIEQPKLSVNPLQNTVNLADFPTPEAEQNGVVKGIDYSKIMEMPCVYEDKTKINNS